MQGALFLITGVIEERKTYNVDYPREYMGAGAGSQTLTGPVLTVPYRYPVVEEKQVSASDEKEVAAAEAALIAGKKAVPPKGTKIIKVTRIATGNLHFFPDNLSVSGNLVPHIRDGGKFKSVLYTTELEVKGNFDTSDLKKKKINDSDLNWQDAYLTFGISDLRGISKQTSVEFAGQKYKFTPGTNGLTLFENGQYATLNGLEKGGSFPFQFKLNLRGSRDINVFPAGKDNKISLQSPWREPSFTGGFLPTHASYSENGFKSLWEVSYFSRNLPQIWSDTDPQINASLAQYMVGVVLETPIDFYQTTVRAVKYGSLFIALTFLTFFIFEMLYKIRVHEIQYLLVGLALSIFFLLLIGISEWLPFMWAYILAAVPTVVQITWYTQAFSKMSNSHLWKVIAGTLTVLYIYLYVLLQLENFSLLFGAIGLFLVLSVVLYVIRNFNWYGDENKILNEWETG